ICLENLGIVDERGRIGCIDPERLPARTLEECGEIESFKSYRYSEPVNDLRNCEISDGYPVGLGDFAVPVNIQIFDISTTILGCANVLRWRTGCFFIIYKEPFCNIACYLIQRQAYTRPPGFLVLRF